MARPRTATVKEFVATLGGAGLLPGAPGTWGSLAALLLLYPVAVAFGTAGVAIACLAGCLLTIWSAPWCEARWGEDPPRVVIDEFAGQAIPLIGLPLAGTLSADLGWLIGALLLFRIFDIMKPLGIARLQHIRSGFGILLDDLLAGVYALACLQVIIRLLTVI